MKKEKRKSEITGFLYETNPVKLTDNFSRFHLKYFFKSILNSSDFSFNFVKTGDKTLLLTVSILSNTFDYSNRIFKKFYLIEMTNVLINFIEEKYYLTDQFVSGLGILKIDIGISNSNGDFFNEIYSVSVKYTSI